MTKSYRSTLILYLSICNSQAIPLPVLVTLISILYLQQLAVEAIIASASKKARCSALLQDAVPILKKLYHGGSDDHIKVRALVVSKQGFMVLFIVFL